VRSPWLDWPNSRKIIEKAGRDEVTKPTKPSFGSFVSSVSPSFPITHVRNTGLPVKDPYAERMRVALRQIAVPSYPPGMILWVETAHSEFYAELTSQIPDEISRLWNDHAPLDEFEAVLVRLVSLHRECCNLYVLATKELETVPRNLQVDSRAPDGEGDAE
jgi:hypothetical protein